MKKNILILKNKINNHFMIQGKKNLCEHVFLKSYKMIQKNTNKNHKSLVKLMIINNAPVILTRQVKKKKRKTVKEFPYVVSKENRIASSVKSIVNSLKKTTKKSLQTQFLSELILSSQNKNENYRLKKSGYQLALTKKKYLFFRWFC